MNKGGNIFPLRLLLLALLLLQAACSVSPPSNMDNLCEIFREKDDWYEDASDAANRWGTSIPVMMAMMHQESRFQQDAKPPRTRILWIFPGPRKSSAYGYPQAKDSTWDWYIDGSGNWGADRDDFADAIDFIGWYNHMSYNKNAIRKDDTYHLYLAYHEGHGGFNRRTFNNKPWLKNVAKKVSARSISYSSQLKSCEKDLKSSGWFFF